MKHSESIKALAGALVKAQGEIEHAHKNATNPHFKNRYADLTEVVDTVRPILTKHGIAYSQLLGYENGVTTVETVLIHGESGEWLSGTAGARVQKDDPQGVGSATTYLRRYSLAAVCGIGQEDDDAEAASAPARAPYPDPRPAQRPVPSSTPNGVKHSSVPDADMSVLDTPAKGKKAGGKTWRQLIADEKEGRGYVKWCIGKVIPDAETCMALQLAVAAAELGDPDFSDQYGVELPAAIGS